MTAAQRSVVVGVFAERHQAEQAMHELREAGFADDQIGFAMRDQLDSDEENRAASTIAGGVTGTVAGGVVAAVAGSLVSIAVPGLGPVIGAGLLATIAGGAAIGGITGILIGHGLSEEEARYYQSEFEAGRALVTVKVGDRYSEALAILSANGAEDAIREAPRPRRTDSV